MTKDCAQCGAVLALATRSCPECGFTWNFESDAVEPAVVDAELEAIDALAVAKQQRRKIAQAGSLEDLKALAVEFGYKPGWAWNLWRARQAKALAYG